MNEPEATPRLRVQYSPGFVEHAVTQAVYGDRKLEAELHRAIDPLYRLPAGRDRERRFSSAYWEFFLKLELNARLAELLEERPLLTREIGVALVHESPGSKSEGAELLVREDPELSVVDRRTLALQLRPETLLDEERLSAWGRRELLHISDMVDPAFGYARWSAEGTPAQDNLVRDRYRVLWDAWVEARLIREGRGAEGAAARVGRMMERAFAGFDDAARCAALDRILAAEALTHAELLAWAREPEGLLGERCGAGSAGSGRPDPGDPCPLCGFSTFDWFEFGGASGERAARSISEAKPSWRVEQGACRQCAEIYAYGAAAPAR